MAGNTPRRTSQIDIQTNERVEKCWEAGIDWELYPKMLKEGLFQIGSALDVPPTAVLASLMSLCGFIISPSVVQVDGTDWKEPVLIWECVCMSTGAGKSPLCTYTESILYTVQSKVSDEQRCWEVGDTTFEKMGERMSLNSNRLFGIYDELTTFLTKLNVYQGKGLSSSHELSIFLQLYNGHSWKRSTVNGDANFDMDSTSLTLAGFTQPAVARNLIESHSNYEKGLPQRFMWMFPKTTYAYLETLQPIDAVFTSALVKLFCENHRKKPDKAAVFLVNKTNNIFQKTYNSIQDKLKMLAGRDELLCGMLSKSKGQILRASAVFHILFHIHLPSASDSSESTDECNDTISNHISDEALCAAVDFVEISIQHAAYIAGRGEIPNEAVKATQQQNDDMLDDDKAEVPIGFTLLQPGGTLDISTLVKSRKYKDRGNKTGLVKACKRLQEMGLGELCELGSTRGTPMKYQFKKLPVPSVTEEKAKLAEKLQTIGVGLTAYVRSFEVTDVISTPPTKKPKTLE